MNADPKIVNRIIGVLEKLSAQDTWTDKQRRHLAVLEQMALLAFFEPEVDRMMLLHIKDGLGAMAYGQFGGSFPNPTQNAVIHTNDDKDAPVWARDNVAETDRVDQAADFELVEKAVVDRMASRRRRYMSANRDMWNRMDPTDFCRPHWFLMHREDGIQKLIPRRVTGDLCKDCNSFREQNGRPPEPVELERFIDTGKWPHKLYDPKTRKAV